MLNPRDTGYPILKSRPTARELREVYTPTAEDLALARARAKGAVAQLGFLVSLKSFQRLGRFSPVVTPSAVLRRLSSHSRSGLHQAFNELGYAVRTAYLLRFMSDLSLRSMVHGETSKVESFHSFSQWLTFGGRGVIAENDREGQKKIVKFNTLPADLVMFRAAVQGMRILPRLKAEGYPVADEFLAALSPYIVSHIKRFGKYELDMNRPPFTIPQRQCPRYRRKEPGQRRRLRSLRKRRSWPSPCGTMAS